MPNHITTVLHCTNPEVIKALVNDEGFTDFGRIIPPPDDPDYTAGGCSHQHSGLFFKGLTDEHPNCWYIWNVQNWGTKWGGYDTEVLEGGVQFDTAWSHPMPVMVALSKRFPNDELVIQYADEDLGGNLSDYKMVNGEVTFERDLGPEYGDDAKDFAAHIKYGLSYAELDRD